MNTAIDVLTYAEQHGITLIAEGDRLVLDAPKGTLNEHILALAKQHKPELMLMAKIKQACTGLTITPEQFLALTTQEDRELIGAGKFSPDCLRAYARSYSEGIQTGRIVFHPTSGALARHGVYIRVEDGGLAQK